MIVDGNLKYWLVSLSFMAQIGLTCSALKTVMEQMITPEIHRKLQQQTILINKMREHIIKTTGFCPYDTHSKCSCGEVVDTTLIQKCDDCRKLICGKCAFLYCDKCDLYLCDGEMTNLHRCKCPFCTDRCKNKYKDLMISYENQIYSCSQCNDDNDDGKANICRGCRAPICDYHIYKGKCLVCELKVKYDKYNNQNKYFDYY